MGSMLLSTANNSPPEDDAMRVQCNQCGSNAIIYSRKEQSTDVSDLYCTCKNPECGHTFVTTLAFKHTISPSKQDAMTMMQHLLNRLDPSDRERIVAGVMNS